MSEPCDPIIAAQLDPSQRRGPSAPDRRCVEKPARKAFYHGHRTTVVAGAVFSVAPDRHAATGENIAMKFGWVADRATALTWLDMAGRAA